MIHAPTLEELRQGASVMTREIDPALVERMENLVREMATPKWRNYLVADEARAIVAELPAPVDPDLIEAREIATTGLGAEVARQYRDGLMDGVSSVQWALLGIKRGRELAQSEPQS